MTSDHDAKSGGGPLPPFVVRLHAGRGTPAELLVELVDSLSAPAEPDPELCREIGSGDLESLLMLHEEELWSEVDRLARSNVRFRRALSSVWAYDSPKFEQRAALLEELGDVKEVSIRFTATPEDFSADPPLSWRALDIPTDLPSHRVAQVLREIADRLDPPQPDS